MRRVPAAQKALCAPATKRESAATKGIQQELRLCARALPVYNRIESGLPAALHSNLSSCTKTSRKLPSVHSAALCPLRRAAQAPGEAFQKLPCPANRFGGPKTLRRGFLLLPQDGPAKSSSCAAGRFCQGSAGKSCKGRISAGPAS